MAQRAGSRGSKGSHWDAARVARVDFLSWPTRLPSGGIFVTLGAGYAHARLSFLEPLEPGESASGDTYEVVAKKDEFGWGAVGALGYEFAIAHGITAGFMISYNYLDIGGSIYDTVQFIPLLANINWYF